MADDFDAAWDALDEEWDAAPAPPGSRDPRWREKSQAKQNAARVRQEMADDKNRPLKDTLAHGALGAANAMNLGLADEVRGLWTGAAALLPGGESPIEGYYRGRDEQRAAEEEAKEHSPLAYGVGEAAGTVGAGLFGGAPGKLAATGLRTAVKEGARAGAAAGGTAAFGHGDGAYDSLMAMPDGAALGAVLGGAGGVAGSLTTKAAPLLARAGTAARDAIDSVGRGAGRLAALADQHPLARGVAGVGTAGTSEGGLLMLKGASKALQRKPAPVVEPPPPAPWGDVPFTPATKSSTSQVGAPPPPVTSPAELQMRLRMGDADVGASSSVAGPRASPPALPPPASSPVPVADAATPTPATPAVQPATTPEEVLAQLPSAPKKPRAPRAKKPAPAPPPEPTTTEAARAAGVEQALAEPAGLNTYEGAVAALRATKDAGDRFVLSSRLDDMGWSSAQRDQLFKAAGLQTQAEQLASAAPSAPAPKPSAPLPEPVPDSGPPLSGAQEARRAAGVQIGPRKPLSAEQLKAAAVEAVQQGEPLKSLARRLGVRQGDVSTYYKAAQIGN